MALYKRSVSLHGHRTSLALEGEFWQVIDEIAESKVMAVSALIAEIDVARDPENSLSSAVRVHALTYALQKSS
ncbi:ribbon-helix-helix domain-containing protein [Roseibium limicola]|uniref:Ribbon-helix-helix domain-containing protein n=1 Tax=Roseibium limicola TaxID=2816037 RepID=A0A939J7U6_9HYPH|nr:ribbon-helix-helix domain-containing protein [Roseibium limicola]MBO0343673.1 ribbon-helix-helix domain-containing protein [Roseibium limicola]